MPGLSPAAPRMVSNRIAKALRSRRRSPGRLAEAGAVAVLLLALAGAGLIGLFPSPYVAMPALLWASVRFGLNGAILGIIALALLGVLSTYQRETVAREVLDYSHQLPFELSLYPRCSITGVARLSLLARALAFASIIAMSIMYSRRSSLACSAILRTLVNSISTNSNIYSRLPRRLSRNILSGMHTLNRSSQFATTRPVEIIKRTARSDTCVDLGATVAFQLLKHRQRLRDPRISRWAKRIERGADGRGSLSSSWSPFCSSCAPRWGTRRRLHYRASRPLEFSPLGL